MAAAASTWAAGVRTARTPGRALITKTFFVAKTY
jgi:hypothetical protein